MQPKFCMQFNFDDNAKSLCKILVNSSSSVPKKACFEFMKLMCMSGHLTSENKSENPATMIYKAGKLSLQDRASVRGMQGVKLIPPFLRKTRFNP